ncbi:hypothetical protein C7H19_02025 [Aphanothece hegewaldii CCALA 016]|uniref:PEP-CTERM sorting domain-containing protein n=1 Tax=Aphanothece hegewaldii CCALA 016 TaxID=2107694 RepID=A0A2T1M269_9CHRO|nr:PEP-CTERM sorting domain-containing protein [Aphanothece hegewaldii]PSF38858.1 hypothetical protein C7H19_02025 [Aphanothece hegewaldii CCALA 016]
MKTKHLLIIGLTASSLAIGSSQAIAASFLIDTFDVPISSPPGFPLPDTGTNPIFLNGPGQMATNTFTGPTNQVIGGQREIKFTQTTSLAPGLSSNASVFTGSGNYDGFFDLDNNSKTNSKAELTWNNMMATGQQNFNVLSGANDEKGIKIDYSSEGIAFNLQLIVFDGMNASTVTKSFNPGGVATDDSALFSFDEILMGGPVDLSMVNYVKLIITGNRGFDLSINQIGTYEIPEPSTLLGLLAVFSTGAFSLKRKTEEK